MDLFSVVEDAFVVLYSKGVYRQAGVYTKGEKLYAKWGSGFVKLGRGGITTVPSVRWSDPEGFQAP